EAPGDDLSQQLDRVTVCEPVDAERASAVAPDRDGGAVDRDRRHDGAQPRTVGKPGVDDRRRPVETLAGRSQDALEHDVDRARRQTVDELELAVTVDPDLTAGVDHDFVDGWVGEVLFERVETG